MLRRLRCHPETAGPDIQIDVGILPPASGSLVTFRYEIRGAFDAIAWPAPNRRGSRSRDELWKTTCFEAFFRQDNHDEYRELNFSPSGDWAAYAFTSYRKRATRAGERSIAGQGLIVAVVPIRDMIVVEGLADISVVGLATSFALSAVIEEIDGTKSYWALRHPPGPPDFHHPDCFALELPALGRP